MDTDFRDGPKKGKLIEPINDLTTPKLPSFDTLDGTGPEEPVEAATADVTETSQNEVPLIAAHASKDKSAFMQFKWTLSKKWTIILAVAAAFIIGGGAFAAYHYQPRGQGGVFKSKQPAYVPKVNTVASVLSGMQVDPSVNTRPVTGVMIENSEDARPQSGLDQADIVFEAIAEGGITRFLALFHDNAPDYLGPVRSARPYYVQWCMSFDCALAHAGGSPEALQNIVSWGTKDLNDSVTAFWRISSRYSPHNLYSSISKLNAYEASKGYGTASFTSLARKKDSKSKTPTATSVDFAISSADYNTHYDYDSITNTYKRSQAGAPHMVVDAAGNQVQLQPKVVVALITTYGIASDKHSQYGVVGSGEAYIFQDGTVTKGSWSKSDTAAPLSLLNEAGQPLAINAGQTWFTALAGSNLLTYK